jgi:hypothetical protein
MRHKNVFALIGIVVLMAGPSTAGHVVGVQSEQERLTPVVNWVLAKGGHHTLEASLVQLLGLGDGSAELPLVRKAFQENDQTVHVFNVMRDTRPDNVVIISKNTERSICWRTTKAGKIVATVRFDFSDHSLRLVPNADYSDLFATELKYWDNTLVRETKTPSPKG